MSLCLLFAENRLNQRLPRCSETQLRAHHILKGLYMLVCLLFTEEGIREGAGNLPKVTHLVDVMSSMALEFILHDNSDPLPGPGLWEVGTVDIWG